MLADMFIRPCPTCRKPVTWETNSWRPFCSERCKTMDLGAWSSEAYRIPEKPSEEDGEGWTELEEPSR
jgi:endogenous inhibitor of DNA gyrase (YacG/DUF329 family)